MGNEEMRHLQTTREWRILLGHKFFSEPLIFGKRQLLTYTKKWRAQQGPNLQPSD